MNESSGKKGSRKNSDKGQKETKKTKTRMELLVTSNKIPPESMGESFIARVFHHFGHHLKAWPRVDTYSEMIFKLEAETKMKEGVIWYALSSPSGKKDDKEHLDKVSKRDMNTLGDIIRQAILLNHRTINEYLDRPECPIKRPFLFKILRGEGFPRPDKLHEIAVDLDYRSFYSLVRRSMKKEKVYTNV